MNLSESNKYLLERAFKAGNYSHFELNSFTYSMHGQEHEYVMGIPVKLMKKGFIILTAYFRETGSKLVDLTSKPLEYHEIKRITTPYPMPEIQKEAINRTVNLMISHSGLNTEALKNYGNIYAKLFGFSEDTKINEPSSLIKSGNTVNGIKKFTYNVLKKKNMKN